MPCDSMVTSRTLQNQDPRLIQLYVDVRARCQALYWCTFSVIDASSVEHERRKRTSKRYAVWTKESAIRTTRSFVSCRPARTESTPVDVRYLFLYSLGQKSTISPSHIDRVDTSRCAISVFVFSWPEKHNMHHRTSTESTPAVWRAKNCAISRPPVNYFCEYSDSTHIRPRWYIVFKSFWKIYHLGLMWVLSL